MPWASKEQPSLNQWYRMIDSDHDCLKIKKDFVNPETRETFYRIVSYYDGIVEGGYTLAQAKHELKERTYRKVL